MAKYDHNTFTFDSGGISCARNTTNPTNWTTKETRENELKQQCNNHSNNNNNNYNKSSKSYTNNNQQPTATTTTTTASTTIRTRNQHQQSIQQLQYK